MAYPHPVLLFGWDNLFRLLLPRARKRPRTPNPRTHVRVRLVNWIAGQPWPISRNARCTKRQQGGNEPRPDDDAVVETRAWGRARRYAESATTACRWSPTCCQRKPDCMAPRTNATCGNAILELRPRQRRVGGVRIYLPRLRRRGSSCAPTDCRSIIQSRPVPLSVRISGVQLDRESASRGRRFNTTVRLFVQSRCCCFPGCRCCLRGTCYVRYHSAHGRFVHPPTPRDRRHPPLARHRTPSGALIDASGNR